MIRAKEGWKAKLSTGEQTQAEVEIQRGILQGYLPTPLLFIITIVSKVNNHSWGWPEGSLFNSHYTEV